MGDGACLHHHGSSLNAIANGAGRFSGWVSDHLDAEDHGRAFLLQSVFGERADGEASGPRKTFPLPVFFTRG